MDEARIKHSSSRRPHGRRCRLAAGVNSVGRVYRPPSGREPNLVPGLLGPFPARAVDPRAEVGCRGG